MNADPQQAKAIFLQAVETHDPEQWPAFLDEACAGQPELRRRVEAAARGPSRSRHRRRITPAPNARCRAATSAAERPARHRPVQAARTDRRRRHGHGLDGPADRAGQAPGRAQADQAGMDSKQVLARFEAERQALALMDHPNIAKVLDGGTTSARPAATSSWNWSRACRSPSTATSTT